MSVTVMSDVMWAGPEDPTDHKILMILASFSSEDGQSCYPSVELLAKLTRFKERTIIRSIKSLETGGWLAVLSKGDGRGNVAAYEIETEKLARRAHETRQAWQRRRGKRVTLTTFARAVKGDSDDKKRVTLTTGKGDFDVRYIRKNLLEPNTREKPYPLTPASGGTGGRPPVKPPHDHTDDALSFYANRIGVTNHRVLKCLREPLRFWMREKDATAYDAAVEMAARWTQYLNDPNRIGKSMPMTTFFTQGYWLNPDSWTVLTSRSVN